MAVSEIDRPLKSGPFARARDALSAFSDTNYRWYWGASFAYYTGLNMDMLAGAQLAYDLTGQAFLLGVAALSQGLPSTLMSLLGGTLADRIPKRRMLLIAQISLAICAVITFLLLATGLIQFWHLLVLGAIRGITTGFSLPARLAMVSEVVVEEQFLRAYGLYYVALNTMRIGGPSIAGALIGLTGGATAAYFVIAAAHLIGLFTLLPVYSRKKAELKGHRASILQDIGGMFAFAWRTPTILVLLGAEMGISLFAMSSVTLLPVFADRVFQAPHGVGLATLQAAAGLGGFVGSLLVAGLGGIKRKPLMLLTAGLFHGATLIAFANTPWFTMAVVVMGLVGICQASYMTLNSTLFQLSAPPDMRGRAMSLYLLGHAVQPLGVVPVGLFADMVGVRATTTVTGSLLVSYILAVALFFPSFRRKEV